MKTNRFLKRLPRLGYRLQVALLLVSGVVVGLGALFLYLLRFHTYLGDDSSACVNCHIMTPYYATWMHGAHARNTTCNDCHVPHDNVFRKYFFKGKDGLNHVYKFVTRQERQAIRAIDESAEVIMENCVRCHAALMAAYLLWFKKKAVSEHELSICDNLVHVGWAFMTIGILFGALWAKEAWGHYWAWDPKETWAAATWFAYLAYIHLRLRAERHRKAALWGLIVSFVLLQMCWWGINYLPSAQGTSVHTYNMS